MQAPVYVPAVVEILRSTYWHINFCLTCLLFQSHKVGLEFYKLNVVAKDEPRKPRKHIPHEHHLTYHSNVYLCLAPIQFKARCSQRRQTSPTVLPPGNLNQITFYDNRLVRRPPDQLRTKQSIRIVFDDSGQFPPLYENMASSTKPKVHNVLHCHQRIKPRPQVACTENLVKFECVVK